MAERARHPPNHSERHRVTVAGVSLPTDPGLWDRRGGPGGWSADRCQGVRPIRVRSGLPFQPDPRRAGACPGPILSAAMVRGAKPTAPGPQAVAFAARRAGVVVDIRFMRQSCASGDLCAGSTGVTVCDHCGQVGGTRPDGNAEWPMDHPSPKTASRLPAPRPRSNQPSI